MLEQLAPLGVDWESIPSANASAQANLAALLDICYIASDSIDTECFQPLRSTADLEELIGPDYRLTVDGNTGVASAKMQHWPITEALGARLSPAAAFPPTWQVLPNGALLVREPSASLIGGSFLGSSGSDGMNEIDIQPGYVVWWGSGRNSWRIQIAYLNGWPTAGLMPSATATGVVTDEAATVVLDVVPPGLVVGTPIGAVYGTDGNVIIPSGTTVTLINSGTKTITLSATPTDDNPAAEIQFGYPTGVTSLIVDDVTGMAGVAPTIFEGATSEGIIVTAAVATVPITVFTGGPPVQVGPGTLTLAAPTRRPHVGGQPASALVSTMPANVRQAGYYYAGAEALQRGGTAFTVQALPGSLQTSGGTPSIGDLTSQAQNQLKNFKRVI